MEAEEIQNEILRLNDLIVNSNYINSSNRSSKKKQIIDRYNALFIKYADFVSKNKYYYLHRCFYHLFIKYIINIYTYNVYKNYIGVDISYFDELLLFLGIYYVKEYNINYEIPIYDLKQIKRIKGSRINNIIKEIYKSIDNMIALDDEVQKEEPPRYITIPQYNPICWFISILTGICYSDLNKQLILKSKLKSSNNIFSLLVKKIINYVTKNYKEYNENIYKDCKLFKFLKIAPLDALQILIIKQYYVLAREYNSTLSKTSKMKLPINDDNESELYISFDEKVFKPFIEFLESGRFEYSRYSYFAHFIIINVVFNENEKKYYLSINENTKVFGILAIDGYILAYLYDLLNIYAKYIYVNMSHGKLSYYKSVVDYTGDEDENDNPQILILEFNNDTIDLTDIYYFQEYDEDVYKFEDDNKILTYNKRKYKLDYILHSNNSGNYYHTISGITYNNKQFIHDSDYKMQTFYCDNMDINITCDLMEQKWNTNIFKELHYCTSGCRYNINCDLEVANNLCFTYSYNITYVYVLIDD